MLNTPVVLLIFNRPNLTEIIFEAIRCANPQKLLVVADGPRSPEESERCDKARAVIHKLDWDCEVLTNFSGINLGCRRRVSTGLDWVFSLVEEAIILEDDCLPDHTFFSFCEELLEKYRYDERIMMISGSNILGSWKSDTQSYHFSYYGGIWGWASWRRAWNYYDVDMKLWSEPKCKNKVRDVLLDMEQYCAREKLFDKVCTCEINTWDYQWSFARLLRSGLSVVPAMNLVSNLGFGEDATHTHDPYSSISNLPVFPMSFPLREPHGVFVDREYDHAFYSKTIEKKVANGYESKLKKCFKYCKYLKHFFSKFKQFYAGYKLTSKLR